MKVKIDAMRLLGEFWERAKKNAGAKGIGKSAVPDGNRTLAKLSLTRGH